MGGKFFCENLGLLKNMVEWLDFHVKIKYLKTDYTEMRKYIAWNCMKL